MAWMTAVRSLAWREILWEQSVAQSRSTARMSADSELRMRAQTVSKEESVTGRRSEVRSIPGPVDQ